MFCYQIHSTISFKKFVHALFGLLFKKHYHRRHQKQLRTTYDKQEIQLRRKHASAAEEEEAVSENEAK